MSVPWWRTRRWFNLALKSLFSFLGLCERLRLVCLRRLYATTVLWQSNPRCHSRLLRLRCCYQLTGRLARADGNVV